ncbi:MAG: aromatic amino acid lyase [Rhodospirillaceae bacterium]|nr:aromatic amino acid lyase [Rhodospirillaceae bacterium]
MTVTLTNRADFTLGSYVRAAWGNEAVVLSDQATETMTQARRAFLHLLDTDPDVVIYGVTSGYGQQANLRFSLEERRRHAARPPRSAASAFGKPLPDRVVRGIVFARLANFVEGHAAISPSLALSVAEMMSNDAMPVVPQEGHGGAGEILALSHLFLPVAETTELGEKDALSLINGSPCAAAVLADAALAGRRRASLAAEVFALSAEAFLAPLDHYDPALDALWGDPEESEALELLRVLMTDGAKDRRPYQAPVSFRILPRLLGRAIRAVKAAEDMAERSLRSITDNPVFLMPDEQHPLGRALSTGGYHNAAAAPALDELSACCADLALLAERQAAKILEGRVSGLPDQLWAGPGDGRYFGTLPMASVGFGEAARHAAQRTFLAGPESGGYAQNDVASNGIPAWRKYDEAGAAFDACLAVLATIASQALHVTERDPPPALAARLKMIHSTLPPVEEPRAMGDGLQALRAKFTEEAYKA